MMPLWMPWVGNYEGWDQEIKKAQHTQRQAFCGVIPQKSTRGLLILENTFDFFTRSTFRSLLARCSFPTSRSLVCFFYHNDTYVSTS